MLAQQVSSFEVPYLPDDKQQQSVQLRLKGGLLGAPCRDWELACIQQQHTSTANASASATANPAAGRLATQSNKRSSSRSAESSPVKSHTHPGIIKHHTLFVNVLNLMITLTAILTACQQHSLCS
jgi:hypothetical protein